ncbi:MAG: hypothetical protein HQL64_03490 [Magnetococcales bacterium]|nr:hypothetical protein [Magnetococcales bacterium]
MSSRIKRSRFVSMSALGLICGVLVMTLPLGACVSNRALVKQESGFSKGDPLVVVVESDDRLGMKGRLEHLLLSQGFNVVSDMSDRKRLVVTEELPVKATSTTGQEANTVKRMTTDIQNKYPVNYAFRFGYQTDIQGDVVKLTGAIVDLRSGEFVFSYEFQDGLVTPFNPHFLGDELAKYFPDNRPVRGEEGGGTLHSKMRDSTSRLAPAEPPVPVKESVAAKSSSSSKVELVKEIAWQTNLLALNTSVEAARHAAPSHPMAAVATEIKNLADRSMLGVLELGTLMHTPVAAEYRAEELLAQLTPELETATRHLVTAQGGKESGQGRSAAVGIPGGTLSDKDGVKVTGPGHDRHEVGASVATEAYPVPMPSPRRLDAETPPTQLAMATPTPKPKLRTATTP